jgi:hypothetical protein
MTLMDLHSSRLCRSLLLLAASSVISLLCAAQASPAGSRPPSPSRVDLFGEYTYFHPINSDMFNQQFPPITGGVAGGITGYFSRSFGIQGEYTYFFNHPDYCVSTVQGGPVLRHQMGRLVPFLHAMGGAARVGPAYAHSGSASPCTWGWVATGGLGLDYILPAAALGNHLALRLVEGDFHYSDVKYSAQTAPVIEPASEGQITAYRLSTGLVWRFGDMSPGLPASFGCEVQPVSVFPGDPITVTGRVINLEESRKLLPVYTWSSSGGRITGSAGGATIATNGMAAGDYAVTGRVSEGSGPAQHAECAASFRVVAFAPPTISCSANPTSILTGGISTITSQGRSPQNRPLSYSYRATAGQITGTGTTATLTAADVRPGTVNVTCNVVDDSGNSASAAAAVAVVAPPPPPAPPAPAARSLCSVSFERDRKKPVRVDNEAKACLDDIAIELNREPDAVLVVVGKHDPQEAPEAAAERTLNVKQYMTDEKGIAANRIEVRTGEIADRTVDNFLVPPGATWDAGGTTSFDPSRVVRHGEPYAPAPHH